METNFNFKSSVCTSIEQSKRLLALGLKKETADMGWVKLIDGDGYVMAIAEDYSFIDIPAWSLHRLIEMIPKNIIVNIDMVFPFRRTALTTLIDNDCDLYEGLVQIIERSVKEGYFYKKYLV